MACEVNAYPVSVGIWTWIPRTQAKLDTVAHTCNPDAPRVRSETETRDSGSSWASWSGGGHSSLQTRDSVSNKMEVKGWHPRLPSDLDTCVMVHACPHIHEQTHGHQANKKSFWVIKKKGTPVQLIFSQNTALLNHTLKFPFIFLLSLKHHRNNKRNRLDWRNLFTFSPRYIDDIIIDKFWYTGKPSCPPSFF